LLSRWNVNFVIVNYSKINTKMLLILCLYATYNTLKPKRGGSYYLHNLGISHLEVYP